MTEILADAATTDGVSWPGAVVFIAVLAAICVIVWIAARRR